MVLLSDKKVDAKSLLRFFAELRKFMVPMNENRLDVTDGFFSDRMRYCSTAREVK